MLFRKTTVQPARLELVPPSAEPDEIITPPVQLSDALADIRNDMPELDELAVRRVARSLLAYQAGGIETLVFNQDSATTELAKVIPLFPVSIDPIGEVTEQS